MDLTTLLTVQLPVIVVVSAILSGVVSLVLLWLYRRAVIRSMGKSGGGEAHPLPDQSKAVKPQLTALEIIEMTSDVRLTGSAKSAYQAAMFSLLRLSVVYILAGLGYALILSLPWMLTAGGGFPLTRLLWLVVCYFWPAIIVLLLLTATRYRQKVILTCAYFGLVGVVASIALVRNPDLSLGQLGFFWLFVNGAGSILLLTFLLRPIRAVGPLVLILMVAGVAGAVLLVTVADEHDSVLRAYVSMVGGLGLDAVGLYVLLQLIGFILLGLAGWFLLTRLGRAYRAKRISDQAITADALWLVFAVLQSFTLASEGAAWVLAGLVGFGLYKVITLAGFRYLVSPDEVRHLEVPRLLLLRVFALGKRSERLFYAFSKRWLRVGSIGLIAGPDLATSTVEPHEFLDFLGGRLSRRFIDNQKDLQQRLEQQDIQPDPDGRYRVNEFFCRQDTWRMTVRRLAADSDVVLMDLRSFSKQNQGCVWELEQLLTGVPLERIILVVDQTTDRSFLFDRLDALWRQLPEDAPNREIDKPRLRIFSAHPSEVDVAGRLVKQVFEVSFFEDR